MDEEDDISVGGGHSAGIVENPLYAENDDLDSSPTYAALRAKEKEAEVSHSCPILLVIIVFFIC